VGGLFRELNLVQAGDTFLLVNKKLDDHLWVILSDPNKDAEKVLIVSLTTAAPHKELICLVQPVEHPWVTHETCVAYNFAKVVSLANLYSWKDAGHLQIQPPLAASLLNRIREQAAESVDLRLEYAELLSDQGLLDL
jgi:hypothetical protein